MGGDGEKDDPAETQRPPLELDVTAFAAGEEAPSPARSSFVPGATIDHFIVLEKLGEGGMGQVLAAYDPVLDRKVALKLLRPQARRRPAADAAQARMLREAQALAKLSHPNVITVYEVGTVGAQVFIAMEFVEGVTLARWLRQERRAERDIVAAFAAAGRGLAAAHAAGLIHRDFKPDNAMVGRDGRLRVLDFGLARAALAGDEAALAGGSSPGGELRAPLTVEGAVMGTPAYMAPEQHLGQEVDARTDQFSFCVALYEALHGERPFGGATVKDLVASVTGGKLREPPVGSSVPGRLRKILCRGLAVDREARYPSMSQLIDELEDDPRARRRRLAIGGGVTLVLGSMAALLLARGAASEEVCTAGRGKLAEVWNPDARHRLEAGFAATGAGYAPEASARTAELLESYGERWVAMYTEACEATQVRGEQSAELLDLRMRCLDSRRGKLAALVALLTATPDRDLVNKAVIAVSAGLPDIARCGDAAALSADVPPPEDPAVKAQVEAAAPALDKVNALDAAGKWREALAAVDDVLPAIRESGWKPLIGQALFRRGNAQRLLGDAKAAAASLEEAAQVSAEAGDEQTLARAWLSLIMVRGYGLANVAEGLAIEPYARAAVALAGGDALRGDLENNLGLVHHRSAEHDKALVHLTRSLELRRSAHGAEHHLVGATLHNLGVVYENKGDLARARQLYLEALELRRKVLGAGHPELGNTLLNLGNVERSLGDTDAALATLGRAIELLERAVGPDHESVAMALQNVAAAHGDRGDYARALAPMQRALAIRERKLGADHPDVALALVGLGAATKEASGDLVEARRLQERALAIFERALGPAHPHLSYALINLIGVALLEKKHEEALGHGGRALRIVSAALGEDHTLAAAVRRYLGDVRSEMGQHARAAEQHRRAIAIYDRALGAAHPEKAAALVGLGVAELGLGRPREALAPLADAKRLSAGRDVALHALATYHLARAVWTAERDATRARVLAAEARALLAGRTGRGPREQLVAIDGFLARLP
jgi:tetratricopeptide (TPR) repeat protein/tRNA A-37 threonylcarbamoyl transferase component Bud32